MILLSNLLKRIREARELAAQAAAPPEPEPEPIATEPAPPLEDVPPETDTP